MKKFGILRLASALAFVASASVFVVPAVAADDKIGEKVVLDQTITNIPGKSLVAEEFTFPPGSSLAPHRHASSSFIMAYVVEGAIRSQVEGEDARVYEAGETWYENPDVHHLVTENASDTESAKLLAVFVLDSDHEALTTLDEADKSSD